MRKVCQQCKIEKDFSEFNKYAKKPDGLQRKCRSCENLYYIKNFNKINAHQIEYSKQNRDRILSYQKEYYQKNKTDIRAKENARQKANRSAITKQQKERYHSDPLNRLSVRLRKRLKIAIRNKYKAGSAVRDLGISIPVLLVYLNLDCLDKYGESYTGNESKYHIDHIRPLSSFNLENREELLIACNWKNLQILLAYENISKGGRYEKVG